MILADRIRLRRKALGMTQDDLSRLLGYTDRSAIAKIESGKNDLNRSKMDAFAKALHTTTAYLNGWTDDYYDYETDEDNRLGQIPSDALRTLIELEGNDKAQIWDAWLDLKNNPALVTSKRGIEFRRPITDDELRFALFGDAENITDADLAKVKEFAAFIKSGKG